MATVAEVVREEQNAILTGWSQAAKSVAAARGLTAPQTWNIMRQLLTSLTEAGSRATLTCESERTLELLVRSRLRQGFSLPDVVEELVLLGRCIHREWLRREPTPDPGDVAQLFATLDAASLLVTDLYTRHMLDEEQTEKLYLRRVRAAVADNLRQGLSIGEQLPGVAALIMEAMDCRCAVVAVYDIAAKRLIGAAGAGAAGERLKELVLRSDEQLLAGETLTAGLLDEVVADVGLVDVADVHGAGVRGVLRVRSATQVGLLGSIHIGIADARPFNAREISRLEGFGSWLTLHLDNARLFEQLEERVAQLREERELREGFVSVLVHDLLGPLAAAKLVAYNLRRGAHSVEKREEFLGRIEGSLDRAERMIRDLLDVNRIHAGQRLTLHVAECRLNDVVHDVVDELKNRYGDRFVADGEADVVGFWSPDELRRALWNLGVNAVKYGSVDTPVTIRLHRSDDRIRLSVHNLGTPIAKEDLPHLFRAFARARGAERSGERGWGLGLALVLACAEAHGGEVTVDSEASTGTELTIHLPVDSRPFQAGVQGVPETASIH